MTLAPGQEEISLLRSDGFAEADLQAYEQETRRLLLDDGFTPSDVDRYFGVVKPDMSRERAFVQEGFQQTDPQTVAGSVSEAFAAGWQMSNTGLQLRGELPDTILPEDVGFFHRMSNQAGMLIGDLPLIVTGFAGGAFVGAPGGPVGVFTLGGAGSAALPEFHRQMLLDHYEAALNGDGNIFTSEEWLTRLGSIMWETSKVAVAGAVGGRGGQAVSTGLKTAGASTGTALLGRGLTEMTAFTGALSGLNGQVPDVQDFLLGATFVVGMHAGARTTARYGSNVVRRTVAQSMDIYSRTGVDPKAQVDAAKRSLAVLSEMLGMDPNGRSRPTIFYGAKKFDPPKGKVKDAEGKLVDREPVRDWDAEAAVIDTELNAGRIDDQKAKAQKIKLATERANSEVPPEVVPENRSKLSEDETIIADMITDRPKEGTLRSMISEFDPREAYTKTAREFHPLEILEKQIEEAGGNFPGDIPKPSQAFVQTYSSALRAGHFVRFGPIEFGTNKPLKGPSYFDAINQAKKDGGTAEGLTYYRLARYTLERSERGIETGIQLDVANRVVKEGAAKYAKAERMVQDVKNGVLKYFEDSGIPKKETVAIIKKLNEFHIPTQRLLGGDKATVFKRGRGLRVRVPFKKATGSKELIIDPILTEIENMHLLIALADRQKVAKLTIEAIEKLDGEFPGAGSEIAAKAKIPTQRLQLDPNEAVKVLQEYGVDAGEAKAFAKDMEPLLLYRKAQKALGPDEVLFFRDGKPEVWKFKDPAVAKVFQGADPLETGFVIKIATKIASLKRSGLTSPPDFPIRNIVIRDAVMKATLQEGFNPIFDPIKGAMDQWGQTASWQQFIAEGGAGASIAAMDVNYISRDIQALFKETSVSGRVLNEIKNPVDLARKFTEFLDNSVRAGGFRKDLARGIPVPKAVERARVGSLDLMQKGSSQIVNLIARTTPFFRPGILGVEQFARGIADNPMRFALRSAAFITLPEVMLYFLNDAVDELLADDPNRIAFKDQPRWIKDIYWNIPVPVGDTGFFIRIPKPVISGQVFGSLVSRFLDWQLKNDPRAFKEFGKTIMGSFIPTFIPAVIDPIVSLTFDTNLFTGRPLTPSSLEQNSAHMQYTDYTSEIAKKLSQVLYQGLGAELSPIHIDALVRGYLGTIGATAIKELDIVVPNTPTRPTRDFFELPFIRSFFARQPGASAKPITDFYDKYDTFKTRAADLRLAIKRMNPAEISQATQFLNAFVKIDQFAKTNSIIIEVIRGIHRNPDMGGDEKRQLIDSQYQALRGISRAGLEIMDALVPPGED